MDKKWPCIMAVVVGLTSILTLTSANAQTEPPQCSDGVDNDNDGSTDFPDDPDCNDANDDTEADCCIGHGFPTEITIRYARKAAAFKGAVTSDRPECSEQRRVLLRRRTSNGARTIARTFTNSHDHWKVYWPEARGRYIAVARRAEVPHSSGATIVCNRDQSVTIRVGLLAP